MMKLFVSTLIIFLPILGYSDESVQKKEIEKPLYKPLIERYILDELKGVRQENQALQAKVTEQISQAKLESADRAINYTTSTVNNIFYIITAAASLLVLLGWRSLNDIKKSLKTDMSKKIQVLTSDYEQRLQQIEVKMTERSKVMIETQQDIIDTNSIHSLWNRVGIEKSDEDKISIYDEILSLKPDDIEAMTSKAEALLAVGEVRWALNLSSTAIEYDSEYSLAYWQRACAYAILDRQSEAIKDIEKAIELSDTLQDELSNEEHFKNLHHNDGFKLLITSHNL